MAHERFWTFILGHDIQILTFLLVPSNAQKCFCLGVSECCLGCLHGVWIMSGGVWMVPEVVGDVSIPNLKMYDRS